MLTKDEANLTADALLAPGRDAQEIARSQLADQRAAADRQRRLNVVCGLIGFAVAGALSYLWVGRTFPLGLAGLVVGFWLAQFLAKRPA